MNLREVITKLTKIMKENGNTYSKVVLPQSCTDDFTGKVISWNADISEIETFVDENNETVVKIY